MKVFVCTREVGGDVGMEVSLWEGTSHGQSEGRWVQTEQR